MVNKDMSDNLKIKQIAKAANVSETVVRRALSNYRNISAESKKHVLDVAKKLGLEISTPSCDVAIVLPAKPEYFWMKFYACLEKHAKDNNLKYRFFLYTSINDGQDILNCLNKAEASKAKIYIIVGQDFPVVIEKIKDIAEKTPVILLEQYLNIENTCYVGENSFESGYELCKLYFKEHPGKKNILMVRSTIDKSDIGRLAGFCRALKDMNMPEPTFVDVKKRDRINASTIARKLSEMGDKCDCICSVSGFLNETCIAVIKVKGDKKIHCIGFEGNTLTKKYYESGLIKLIVDQDMDGQSKEAIKLVKYYLENNERPKEKFIYIKSKPWIQK